METTNALLVALMFVTILSIGIGNLLAAIASFVEHPNSQQLDWIQVSWIVLLLLVKLNMFWETLAIFEIEKWAFAGFLYMLIGPMLLFIASQVVLAGADDETPKFSRAHYFIVERKFFLILCLVMIWTLGVDVTLGQGLTSASAWNFVGLVLFALLAVAKSERIHAACTAVVWILLLTLFALRGVGIAE